MSGQSCSVEKDWSQPVLWVSATVEAASMTGAPPTSLEGYADRLHYLYDNELVIWRPLTIKHRVTCKIRVEVPPHQLLMSVKDIISFDERIAWPFIKDYLHKFLSELDQALSNRTITNAEAYYLTIDFAFERWAKALKERPLMVSSTIQGDPYTYHALSLPMNPEPAAIAAAISAWLNSTPEIEA